MSELVDRFLARESLSPEDEDKAIAEIVALLEQRPLAMDSGRLKAWESTRQWGERVRDTWKAEARLILGQHPHYIETPKRLSFEVWESCNRKGFTKRDGKPHDQMTIYNYLLKARRDDMWFRRVLNDASPSVPLTE